MKKVVFLKDSDISCRDLILNIIREEVDDINEQFNLHNLSEFQQSYYNDQIELLGQAYLLILQSKLFRSARYTSSFRVELVDDGISEDEI